MSYERVRNRLKAATTRGISRRRFVQGVLAGSAVAGFNLLRWPFSRAEASDAPAVLSGNHFDLVVEHVPVNITGKPSFATAVNGLVPGPTLRWREGDTVTIAVTNRLGADTSIHWHGIRSPSDMDGVPGLSFAGIAPNETFVYRIPVRQHGTYWYHSHSHFQEQTGHYGPLIIDPPGKDPIEYDREYVILLSEWTDEDPDTIFSNLKQYSDYYNYHQRTARTFVSDARTKGLGATISDRLMWGEMNMAPTDFLDVTGAAYTYLVNGYAPGANWTGIFRPKERVRLRFINGSSMTIFDVRIPNLPMTVVQTDGNDVEPVTVDEFRISVAETYDVIVEPPDSSAYTIFVQSLDRSGYARATLAPRIGMTAPVPPLDPRPLLTMVDMGMGSMGSGGHGMPGMSPNAAPEASGPGMNMNAAPVMKNEMSGMSDSQMAAMPGMKMTTAPPANSPLPAMSSSAGYSMPFPQPGPDVMVLAVAAASGTPVPPRPIDLHEGPQVDNVAAMPSNRLAEPGNGLNNNGRRVLTYADLRARYRGVDPRPPGREIELHLTGNMDRFIWGFNGDKFSSAEPIRMRLGERVRIILVNDTMMEHPIHLHGLWSELENGHDEFRPYKHTINVKPGERLSYLVSADTPGHWAYHCHLLYHMEAGMFRKVIVS
ncbi:MAG: copper resistance system multicopper oxidase [Candidatus Binataceae bacterium]